MAESTPETMTPEEQAVKRERDEIVARMQATHEEVCSLAVREGFFVFRRPDVDEFEDHQDAREKGKRMGPIRRDIVGRCLVHGEMSKLRDFLARKPAAATEIMGALLTLATNEEDVVIKKG